MVKTRSSDRKSQQKTNRPSASYQRNARSPQVDKRVRNETPKTSIRSRRRKSNNIEVRYVAPSDDEIVAPYMKDILYKKPLQPHVREDMQFGDTGDMDVKDIQVMLKMTTTILLIYHRKGKKTPSRFHPPTEEHTTREYYPTEPEGHDIHTSPQPQATHADDEPKPAVFEKLREELRGQMTDLQCTNKELTVQPEDLKSQLLDLKRDRSSQIDHLIHVQAKATEKSEVHSVGDAPQQEKVTDIQPNIDRKGKGKRDPADEIEYPSFPPTPSFDLGVALTPIISNEVDAIIAGVSSFRTNIRSPIKRAPKPTRMLQSPYVTGAGKQIKHSDDDVVFDKHDKHVDEADIVAFQNWFNRGYKPRNKYVRLMSCALIYEVG
ncbi:Hypothetical predicted protein [Olea europaea subsp. europaea]|uniref:Uncharacterized protein n=1 Tax=Olea europaea subsp. europaea TaxID=158383 RepID=A0A8S0TI47_OLEEU|nr:Hypothetical predicted protein [Olea europaea subsp. europaea]